MKKTIQSNENTQQKEKHQKEANKKESPLLNLLFNIVIPALILSKGSSPEQFGPFWAFLIALSFPTAYGILDFIKCSKPNFISILGFISILLTGGLGLLKVDGIWFAVKEAAVPAVIGIAVLGSQWTKKPLVKTLFFTDKLIRMKDVREALEKNKKSAAFEELINRSTWLFSASFFLSAILNFALARYLLNSPVGSEQFNIELGTMTAMSYPVIVLPCMAVTGIAMWKLIQGIKSLTGMRTEEIFRSASDK